MRVFAAIIIGLDTGTIAAHEVASRWMLPLAADEIVFCLVALAVAVLVFLALRHRV